MAYKYFLPHELRCSHCGAERMQPHFMENVIILRELLGFPFIVTSAYRCKNHPIEVRKDSPGAHTTGQALSLIHISEPTRPY